MLIKILGAASVLLGAFLLGRYKAMGYRRYIAMLQAFVRGFVQLASEIGYGYVPLSSAFVSAGDVCGDGEVALFFQMAKDMLEENPEQPVAHLWETCLDCWTLAHVLDCWTLAHGLDDCDRRTVADVGSALGCSDSTLQLKLINRDIERLEGRIKKANEELFAKSRLAFTLPLAVGVLVCILLV